MAVYVTVSEGDSPATATPILATHDPQIVAAIARELTRRLGMADVLGRVLTLARGAEKSGETDVQRGDGSEDLGLGLGTN